MKQYTLIQCPTCRKWYIVGVEVSVKRPLMFEHLYAIELTLRDECTHTKHKGRRKASL